MNEEIISGRAFEFSSGPRKAKPPGRLRGILNKVWWVELILFLLVMTLGLLGTSSTYSDYAHLRDEGVSIQGEWVSRRAVDSDYYVIYSFVVNDQQYMAEQESKEHYEQFERGGTVTVVYSPDNPAFSTIEGTNESPVGLIVALALMAGFGLHSWARIRYCYRSKDPDRMYDML